MKHGDVTYSGIAADFLFSLIFDGIHSQPVLFHVIRRGITALENANEVFQFRAPEGDCENPTFVVIGIHMAVLKVRLDPATDYRQSVSAIKENARTQVANMNALDIFLQVCLNLSF